MTMGRCEEIASVLIGAVGAMARGYVENEARVGRRAGACLVVWAWKKGLGNEDGVRLVWLRCG